jgi:hypothetical protein
MFSTTTRLVGRAESDVHLFDGREGFEHPLDRELPAKAVLLDTAVGLPDHLPAALVDLDPTGIDTVGCAQCAVEIVAPQVGRQTVMRVVAMAMTSSSCVHGIAMITGPKISSRASRHALSAREKTVRPI